MLAIDGAADLRAIVGNAQEVQPDAATNGEMAAAEVGRLAELPPLDYERERRDAARRLGVRASILDRLVEERRAPEGESDGSGRALSIRDIELWPSAVNGASLLDELVATIRRHVVLDEAAADAIALWIVHTHAIKAAYISPRLAITSPEKRCGKTTLLSILTALVARPLSAAKITPATVFRAIEAARPSLLVDEADTFVGEAEQLRGIINAGHCRATATVLRTVETRDGYEVREFSVWGAVALAAIGRLPGTIEDRALKVALRRRRPDEIVDRVRLDRLHQLQPLARGAARWVADNVDALEQADPDVPGRCMIALPTTGARCSQLPNWPVPTGPNEHAGPPSPCPAKAPTMLIRHGRCSLPICGRCSEPIRTRSCLPLKSSTDCTGARIGPGRNTVGANRFPHRKSPKYSSL